MALQLFNLLSLNIILGIKRPSLKVTNSTRVCSAHFSLGSTIPYVKSPSLVKKNTVERRPLVRHLLTDKRKVPSLKKLAMKYISVQLSKVAELQHKCETMQVDHSNQVSVLMDKQSQLSGTVSDLHSSLNQALQATNTLQQYNSELLARCSRHEDVEKQLGELKQQVLKLKVENESLQTQVSQFEKVQYRLRAENFKGRDKEIQFYTGFATWNLFHLFFQSLEVYDVHNLQYIGRERTFPDGKKRGPPRALDPLNEFFLTVIRLRLGLMEADMADRFGISQSLVSVIFNTWLSLLYRHLSSLIFWPSRETVQKYMPLVFSRSEAYGNTRIIIDATELFIQKPSDLSLQSVTWSNYKSRNTLKGLVGICPFGGVTFVSDLWAGSISDNELTLKCGLLESGDNVMADKGFTIDEQLHSRGVTLNIPPFMKDGKLTAHDVKLTREIATLRIHVLKISKFLMELSHITCLLLQLAKCFMYVPCSQIYKPPSSVRELHSLALPVQLESL